MVSAIPDYFLACGNKNDAQEIFICNLWLLFLTGYICCQFPNVVVLLWLVSGDFIMAQTTKYFGLDHHASDEQLVPDSDGSTALRVPKRE
jgi:hypothetical protein